MQITYLVCLHYGMLCKISIWVYHTNWSCTLCQQMVELKWINKWFNSSWGFFVFVIVDTCTCVFTYLSSYQNIIIRFWCILKLEYLNFKWCKRFAKSILSWIYFFLCWCPRCATCPYIYILKPDALFCRSWRWFSGPQCAFIFPDM